MLGDDNLMYMPIQIISYLIHYMSLIECKSMDKLKGDLLANHPLYCISEPARALFN